MLEDRREISTRPTLRDWTAYIAGFFGFTAIAAILPLLAVTWFYINMRSGRAPAWVIVSVLLFGAVVALWFICTLIGRQCWRLSESELITGITGKVRYPLSSIERIIVGLPGQIPIPGSSALLSPAMKELYAEIQKSSLLLVFRDGSMLPLKLRLLINGSRLTDTLLERLRERVVRDYAYSKPEIALLRRADPNALIRKPS
jgi:hypothetical protein